MKILIINHLYPPDVQGGAETVVYARAQALQKAGHEVMVLTTRPYTGLGSLKLEKTVEDGVVVYRFFPLNLGSYQNLATYGVLRRAFWFMVALWGRPGVKAAKNVIQEINPDMIETHNLFALGFGIPRTIQNMKKEHRVVLHDVQLVEPSGILSWNHHRDSLVQSVYAAMMRSRFGKPTVVETPSLFLQEFYQSRGFFRTSRWQVVRPSAVSNTDVKPAIGKFLFAGSLVMHKGLECLQTAWELYGNARAHLSIVGKGPLLEELKIWAATQSNVTVHGPLYNEDLKEAYRSADTLLFPSICLENYPKGKSG